MVSQVLGEYQARGIKLAAYIEKPKTALGQFQFNAVEQVPQEQNSNAVALPRLDTTSEVDTLNVVLVEFLSTPSISEPDEEDVCMIDSQPSWTIPIIDYL